MVIKFPRLLLIILIGNLFYTRVNDIMKTIHQKCQDAAEQYGAPGNYVVGANAAGFVKVVEAMIDQGLV
jgi:glutamate dehydrogenase (NADP+)